MLTVNQIIDKFRVPPEKKIRLKDYSTDWDGDDSLPEEERRQIAAEFLAKNIEDLAAAQELLYAANTWSVLCIFQALDAAGKDGTIKHVLSGLNPQGCHVSSFKAPSETELDHDFLWRTTCALPERGRIGIFNRSYYEEVLVVRVHPEFLAGQKLPPKLAGDGIWKERFEDIRNFESYLGRNGVVTRKFFLHVSKEEQRKRFLDRLNEPKKNWKFSANDVKERAHWDDYMDAYEDMIRHTATKEAPWYVVPADNKWFTRIVVAGAIIETLQSLDLHFPKVGKSKVKELADAKHALLNEK